MMWTGKAVGALLGSLIGGWIGGLIGLAVGHQFDQGISQSSKAGKASWGAAAAAKQRAFFETTFGVMGHIAKADGRVTEEEIRAARGIMHRMQLTPEMVKAAIANFTAGKDPGYPLTERLAQLRRTLGNRRDLYRAFVEIQLQALIMAGPIRPGDRELLWRVARELGVGRVELAQIEALVRAQTRASSGQQADTGQSVAEAYRVLGVAATATDREVKTAYRRLMNQHHPDKLVARGLPESMMEVSKEKTREIRSAYDRIKAERGIT